MISLAELRSRNVTPIWQEAIAVIQELIQTVKATTGSAELLPDLEHIALIPNGDVVALPGSPEPAVAVRHAAVMLKLLVDGVPVPPELEQFISRNVAQPPQYDSVAEFSRNLAFFERPGRRSDVERLVGRALAAEQTSRAEEELKRLKERASEATQTMEAPEFLQQPKRAQTVPIALVAAMGVAVLAVGLWLWQRVSARQPTVSVAAEAAVPAGDPAAPPMVEGPTPTEQQPAVGATADVTPPPQGATPPAGGAGGPSMSAPAGATAVNTAAPGGIAPPVSSSTAAAPSEPSKSALQRAGDAVRTAVNSLVGAKPAPASSAVATTLQPTTETKMANPPGARSRRSATTTARATVPKPPPAAPPAPPPALAVAAPVPVPVPVRIEPAPAEPVIDEAVAIFTAADAAVTPAVIVRPVLPKEFPPGVPPEQIGTIDVIVDEQGDVLSVKLISPANRYHERMLVSAAKMWKFRPAYKDGRPVRYKARVRLTI